MINSIKTAFSPQIENIGVCDFESIMPILECRAASRLPENPRSVIVCLFPYYTEDFLSRNVARYAIVNDYHEISGDMLRGAVQTLSDLYPDEEFVPFVDSSPIREVEAARQCGLGNIGKNGLLINEKYGSYVFIGTIVTTMIIAPDNAGDYCNACENCMNACPTGALGKSGIFDKTLCRSYITQKKDVLTQWEWQQVQAGGMVWGCDICLTVCPHNQNPVATPIKAFYENNAPVISIDNLDMLYPDKPYNYRKKDVLLRNLACVSFGDEKG